MKKEIFKDTILELHEYFQKDKRPSNEVLKLWWDKCNTIPDRFMVDICNRIEEQYERLPTNLPRAMRTIYIELVQGRTKTKDDYDKIEDPDFPPELVREGSRVLAGKRDNIVAFHRFCDGVGMPKRDRERIQAAAFRRFRIVAKSDDNGTFFDLYDGDRFIHSGRAARDKVLRAKKPKGDWVWPESEIKSGMEV